MNVAVGVNNTEHNLPLPLPLCMHIIHLLNIQHPQPLKEISASPHQYIISTDVVSDHRIQAGAQFIWNYGLDTILMYTMLTT